MSGKEREAVLMGIIVDESASGKVAAGDERSRMCTVGLDMEPEGRYVQDGHSGAPRVHVVSSRSTPSSTLYKYVEGSRAQRLTRTSRVAWTAVGCRRGVGRGVGRERGGGRHLILAMRLFDEPHFLHELRILEVRVFCKGKLDLQARWGMQPGSALQSLCGGSNETTAFPLLE